MALLVFLVEVCLEVALGETLLPWGQADSCAFACSIILHSGFLRSHDESV